MNVIETVRDTAGHTQRFVIAAALSLGVLAAQTPDVSAADDKKMLLWMDNSYSVLYGTGFEIDPEDQWDPLLLEHVSGWSFGDLYTFVEYTQFKNSTGGNNTSWYGEFSPRLSFGKILGKDMSFSFGNDIVVWKDTLFAMTYERGRVSDKTESLLLGLGFDMDLSVFGVVGDRFEHFQLNIYARNELNNGAGDDPERGFKDLQITVVAAYPLEIGRTKILIDGFIDYVAGFGPQAKNFHFSPQIKLDIGNYWGKPGVFYAGVDIDYWTNKYGIQDSDAFKTDQLAVSFLVKYHF